MKIRTLRRLIKHSKFLKHILLPHTYGLKFDMWTACAKRYNGEYMIPWIIDFFLEESSFISFNEIYKQYPLVLISSKEVYDALMAKKHIVKDVNFKHVALSLSDKYKISSNTKYEIRYDVVLMGRQNSVMEQFFYQYLQENPSLKYAYRRMENGAFNYYTVENGIEKLLGDINTREQYIKLMQQSKIGIYATPDIDTDHERSHGYNQVTPRFLEWVSCGAHIIARYIPNPDTEYYKLQDFSSPINTYEEFKIAMNYAMNNEVDMSKYANYLAQHYTTVRAAEIKQIVSEL